MGSLKIKTRIKHHGIPKEACRSTHKNKEPVLYCITDNYPKPGACAERGSPPKKWRG